MITARLVVRKVWVIGWGGRRVVGLPWKNCTFLVLTEENWQCRPPGGLCPPPKCDCPRTIQPSVHLPPALASWGYSRGTQAARASWVTWLCCAFILCFLPEALLRKRHLEKKLHQLSMFKSKTPKDKIFPEESAQFAKQ